MEVEAMAHSMRAEIKEITERILRRDSMRNEIKEAIKEAVASAMKRSMDSGISLGQPNDSAIKKLFDNGKFVGTFEYVTKEIGLCAFHEVVVGTQVSEEFLRVEPDGYRLIHLISYPFYDISFYWVLASQDLPHLDLSRGDDLYRGAEIMLVAYPEFEMWQSRDKGELPVVSRGHVARMQVQKASPLILAEYACFPGCSGGAVLSNSGTLVGMHTESIYKEDNFYYTVQPLGLWKHVREDTTIEFPNLTWQYGINGDPDRLRFIAQTEGTLASYAAVNVPHKASFGAFVPSFILQPKLETAKRILKLEFYGEDGGDEEDEEEEEDDPREPYHVGHRRRKEASNPSAIL